MSQAKEIAKEIIGELRTWYAFLECRNPDATRDFDAEHSLARELAHRTCEVPDWFRESDTRWPLLAAAVVAERAGKKLGETLHDLGYSDFSSLTLADVLLRLGEDSYDAVPLPIEEACRRIAYATRRQEVVEAIEIIYRSALDARVDDDLIREQELHLREALQSMYAVGAKLRQGG